MARGADGYKGVRGIWSEAAPFTVGAIICAVGSPVCILGASGAADVPTGQRWRLALGLTSPPVPTTDACYVYYQWRYSPTGEEASV